MKIIVVLPGLKLWGGATRFAWEFSEYLASQGDDVIVVSLYADRNVFSSKENIKIIDLADENSLPKSLKFWFNLRKTTKKLTDLIKNEKPDLVFFNHFPCQLWAENYGNIPTICYPEDVSFLYSGQYTKDLPLTKYILWMIIRLFVRIYDKKKWKYFDTIICNSKFTANLVSRFYQVEPKLIYFGTDTKIFTPNELLPKKRAILTLGDANVRRADMLIKATSRLVKKRSDFKIWVVGNHGYLEKKLQKLVKRHKLTGIVEFFGKVSDSKLAQLYSESLAVAHLVKEAPFGMIVIEAMACGAPVIACKPGGTEESVVHGETGFLIEDNDQSSLIKYIEKLLDEPQLSEIMGKKGRDRALKYFDRTEQNRQLREFLQDCIHKKSNT